MRFVHAADIHLGSPLGGLDLRPDAPAELIRSAPRRAFTRLIDYCLCESVDLLLIAGDLFDGRADLATQLFAEEQLRRLAGGGVRCVLLRGNHDAASRQTLTLRLPDGAHELSVERPETVALADLGVAVHGRGFAEQHVSESIVSDYPPPVTGLFNIGMLHTSASGPGAHAPYAPCTVEQLLDRGYDYWALGHIHKRTVLADDPPIIFCGNLQGRDPGEIGAKGATVVRVEHGVISGEPTHVELDVVRWHRVTVDVSACAEEEAALAAIEREIAVVLADGEESLQHVVRIEVVGRTALHRGIADAPTRFGEQVRQRVAEAGQDQVWVERLRFDTSPPLPPLATIRARDDLVGDLARDLAALTESPQLPATLAGSLEKLRSRLPPALIDGERAIELPGLSAGVPVSQLLASVERDLLSRLVSGEPDAPAAPAEPAAPAAPAPPDGGAQ